MNVKTTIGLVAALLLAVIGVWWAQSRTAAPGEKPEAVTGPRALFDPPLGEITELEILPAEGPALAFKLVEAKWRLTQPVEGPAEHFTVANDVTKIKDLRAAVSFGPKDAERPAAEAAGLASPRRTVKLVDAAGRRVVVKIGNPQPLSTRTYVQVEGDDTIHLVDADLNRDLRRGLAEYRGKRLTEFVQNDAVRVEVSGERDYVLVKSGARWTMESPLKGRVDAAKVSGILRTLSGLSVSEFVEDNPAGLRPFGLETPRLRLTVTTETKKPKPATQPDSPETQPAEPAPEEIESRTVSIALGGVVGDKVYAMLPGATTPTIFSILQSQVDQLAPPVDDVRDRRLSELNIARASRIAVTIPGDAVELTKTEGKWRLTAGGPATGEEAEYAAVDDLLRAVRDLKATGFELADSPAFGLASPRATVEVTVEGEVEPVRLTVGGLTPSQTGAYVRNDREGFIAVVKAESVEPLAVRPMSFLSRELLKFDRNTAERIEIARNSDLIAVHREDAQWNLVLPVSARAETGAVDNILADLSNLRGRRVVGSVAEAAAFGLSPALVKVAVTVAPQAPATTQPESAPAPPAPEVLTLAVGRRGEQVYAMREGGRTICEIDGKVLENLEAELLDPKVATLDTGQVRRVSIRRGDAGFSFEKKGAAWELNGEASFDSDPAKLTAVLESLRDLKAARYVRYAAAALNEFGLDRPALAVTVETEDAAKLELLISAGGPADQSGRFASISTTPDRVFVIKSDDVAKFDKQVQDFRKAG